MVAVPKCDRCGHVPFGREDDWVTIDLVKWRGVGGGGSVVEMGGLLRRRRPKNTWHEVDLCGSCVVELEGFLVEGE